MLNQQHITEMVNGYDILCLELLRWVSRGVSFIDLLRKMIRDLSGVDSCCKIVEQLEQVYEIRTLSKLIIVLCILIIW